MTPKNRKVNLKLGISTISIIIHNTIGTYYIYNIFVINHKIILMKEYYLSLNFKAI